MRALIIDDESMPAKYLASLLKRNFPEFSEIKVALGSENGKIELEQSFYDVLFLDVEMPIMTGFELIEAVVIPSNTKIIFTTAYKNYALDAYRVNAIDYLVKPISELDLFKAIKKVGGNVAKQNDSQVISFYSNNEHVILDENEVIRLEADGSYTKVITEKTTILSCKNLKQSSLRINNKKFYRCHNSHIVNVSKIDRISKGKGGYILLKNKDIVPLSKSKFDGLSELIGI